MVDDKKVRISMVALSLVGTVAGFLIVGMSSSWWTAIGMAVMIGGNNLDETFRAERVKKVLASGNKGERNE